MKQTFKEMVRKRPGMYIGDIKNGPTHLVFELIANAIDLFLKGKAKKIIVDISDNKIVVADDGPGFPFENESINNQNFKTEDLLTNKSENWEGAKFSTFSEYEFNKKAEEYLTVFHDTPTADNHAPHIHVFKYGVGLAVVNALSKELVIESSNGKIKWKQKFGKGNTLTKPIFEEGKFDQGARVTLEIDKTIFKKNSPNLFEIRRNVFELIHLYPGLIIQLNQESFVSKNGLLDLGFLLWKGNSTFRDLPKMFCYQGFKDNIQFQVAAIGDAENNTVFRSWANGCLTPENGTHVKGFMEALHKNHWLPAIALIHIIMHQPEYAGPTKDCLNSIKVRSVLESELSKPIKQFLKKHKIKL